MFGEWIPILIFYGLVIGVAVTLGLFVSINIPLIVFDKSMQLFNFLSGSNFLNQLIFNNGEISWTFENTFFLIYLVFIFIAFVVAIVLFVKTAVAKTFDTSFGNVSNKNRIKWFVNFVASILLIPFVFVLLNSITSIFTLFFNQYLIQSNNPISISQAMGIISNFSNQNVTLQINVQKLLDLVNSNSDSMIQNGVADQTTINSIVSNLKQVISLLTDNNSSLSDLLKTINSTALTTEQINALNSVSANTAKIVSQINGNAIYSLDLEKVVNNPDGTTISQPFLEVKNQLALVTVNSKAINDLLISNPSNITLNQIAWLNNSSSYKMSNLTVQLTTLIIGFPIYDLYNPILTVAAVSLEGLGAFFTGQIWLLIVRICVFVPAISVCAAIIFNIIIKLIKRIISIIGLLITSPVICVSAIEDDGTRFNLWVRTSLSKFFFITFAAFALMLYRIILPQLFNLTSTVDLNGAWGNDLAVFMLLINVAILVGTTYGMKKIIDFGSEIIGEQSGLGFNNGIGVGARNKFIGFTKSLRGHGKTVRRGIMSTKDKRNFKPGEHFVNKTIKAIKPKIGKSK